MSSPEIEVLIALLTDMGQEVRSRRDPESVLTAAFVAASGAVAWGVSTLRGVVPAHMLLHPALVAAIGLLLVGVAVVTKILREYRTYKNARAEQGRIAAELVRHADVSESHLPEGLHYPRARSGHIFSVLIVLASGVAAVGFCVSIFLLPTQ